jgi:hypothetical protein
MRGKSASTPKWEHAKARAQRSALSVQVEGATRLRCGREPCEDPEISRECRLTEWTKILLRWSAKICTFLKCVKRKPFIYFILQWQPSCISVHVMCSFHPTPSPE